MKIVLIGSRGHVSYVFSGLSRVPEVEIAAVSGGGDPPRPLLEMCAGHGIRPALYGDWRKMVDEVSPSLAVVDGPFEEHAAMAAWLLERNIHVFCEKPVALDMEQFSLVSGAYRNSTAHIRSMVGLRYAPPFLHAYRMIMSGAVGKVKSIRTRKSYKLGERPDFYRHRESYGGTLLWVGSHALDWIQFYSRSEFDRVTAYHEASDNCGHGDLEVAAHGLFLMKNGVIADAGIDYLRPAAAATHGDDRVRIAGTRGIIEIAGGRLFLLDDSGEREEAVPPADRDVFSDFILELTTDRPSLVTDRETFALALAAVLTRDSADAGKTMEVPQMEFFGL